MAYVTKFDGRTDKTVKVGGEGNPTSIEGYFLGSKDTVSDYGPGKLHLFQTHEGIVGVWGKTRMNNLLTEDHKGQMVLLTYTGMIAPTKKGMRPSYGFKLQYDASNTIDISNIDLSASPAASEEEETGDEYVSQEETYEEEQVVAAPARPVAPQRPAAAPDASRQAKVQALLTKNRR